MKTDKIDSIQTAVNELQKLGGKTEKLILDAHKSSMQVTQAQNKLDSVRSKYNIATHAICCNCSYNNDTELNKWLNLNYETSMKSNAHSFHSYYAADSNSKHASVKIATLMEFRDISPSGETPSHPDIQAQLQMEHVLNNGGHAFENQNDDLNELTWFCMQAAPHLEQCISTIAPTKKPVCKEAINNTALAVLWEALRKIVGDLTLSNIAVPDLKRQLDCCRWDIVASHELPRELLGDPSVIVTVQKDEKFVKLLERTGNRKTLQLEPVYTYRFMRNVDVDITQAAMPARATRHSTGGDVISILLLTLLISFIAYSYYQCATGRFMKNTQKYKKTKKLVRLLLCVVPIIFPFPGVLSLGAGLFTVIGASQAAMAATAVISPLLATPLVASIGTAGEALWTAAAPAMSAVTSAAAPAMSAVTSAAAPAMSAVTSAAAPAMSAVTGPTTGFVKSAINTFAGNPSTSVQSGGGFLSGILGKFQRFLPVNKMHVQWVYYKTKQVTVDTRLIYFRRVIGKSQYTHELVMPAAYFKKSATDPHYFMNQFFVNYFGTLRRYSSAEKAFDSELKNHETTVRNYLGDASHTGLQLNAEQIEMVTKRILKDIQTNRSNVLSTLEKIPDFKELLHSDSFCILTPTLLLERYCPCVSGSSMINLKHNRRCSEIVNMLNISQSLDRMKWITKDTKGRSCFSCNHTQKRIGGSAHKSHKKRH
jgi:hypothetical protein